MSAHDLKPGYDFRNSIAAFRLSPCCTFRSLLLFSSCKTTKEGKKKHTGPKEFPSGYSECPTPNVIRRWKFSSLSAISLQRRQKKKWESDIRFGRGAKKYVFMASGKERKKKTKTRRNLYADIIKRRGGEERESLCMQTSSITFGSDPPSWI